MGIPWRAIWSVITKRWAYVSGSLLCIVVVALFAASCGTCWYEYKNTGNVVLFPVNGTTSTPVILYNVYYEQYDYFVQVQTSISLGGFVFTQNCDYSGGDCPNLVDTYYSQLILAPPQGANGCPCKPLPPVTWNLNYYKQNYSTMFAFDLCAILLTIVVGILLQIICWTFDRWPGKVTLGLFIVLVVAVVVDLIFCLVCWSILFGHPLWMRQSLSLPDDWCAGGQVDSQSSSGNVLCVWNGDLTYNQYISNYDGVSNLNWQGSNPNWGPSTAWDLFTIGFGLLGFVFLLTVGWRPTFKL